jgi:hypothetical protein
MKNLKLFFLIPAIIILSLSCNKNSVNESTTEESNSNNLQITVTLPDGWTKVDGSVLEHQYGKGTASFMIKNEYVLNGKDLDTAVNEAKTQIGNFFNNTSFAETQNITIDGLDARSITFSNTIKAAGMTMNMKFQHVYVMVNKKCYLIAFGDQESSFNELTNDFQQILNGIKFEN